MAEHGSRWAALALLALFCAIGASQTSLVVDGTRYFWLYEDPMVSMRCARNLVEGQGLVWNAGERAEGYASLAWTLVMAGVHLLRAGDAKASLVVQALGCLLACSALLLSERLLRHFHPRPGLALFAVWAGLVPCFDLLFWSISGFEMTLLAAVFLLAAVRLLEEQAVGPRLATYLLVGLLPLVRRDGLHPWLALALVALGTSPDRRRSFRLLAASSALPLLHLLFRYGYHGHWLPEAGPPTVTVLPEGFSLGLRYVGRFLRSYGLPLALALAGGWLSQDRRRWLLLAGLPMSGAYLLATGGEALPGSPYLAHLVPVVVVLAAAALVDVARERPTLTVPAGVVFAVFVVLSVGSYNPTRLAASESAEAVTGVLLDRFTAPDATIGVFAPGAVPYFSRRPVVPLLDGPGPEAGLARRPDVVVVHLPHETVATYAKGRQTAKDNLGPVLRSPVFREEYLPNPLPILDRTTVYFRTSSPEAARRALWKMPETAR